MAAQTFSGTATTSDTDLDLNGVCLEFRVSNTGSVDLLVNVDVLHGTDYDTVGAGETEYYRAQTSSGIGVVKVKTGSSTTTYTAGVTAK